MSRENAPHEIDVMRGAPTKKLKDPRWILRPLIAPDVIQQHPQGCPDGLCTMMSTSGRLVERIFYPKISFLKGQPKILQSRSTLIY